MAQSQVCRNFEGWMCIKIVYPKFHWLRQLTIFGRDSICDQKGAMANTN